MNKIDKEIALGTPKKNPTKHLSKKWDKSLDDYNNYLKEYMKHYKKSLKGNLVSLTIYPYMKEKTLSIYERLVDAKNKSILTEKQIKRISKIQTKIITACKIKNK